MKYSKLSKKAKAVARKDYQNGWLETHNDIFTDEELDEFCRDTDDDIEYDTNGKLIWESEL